MATGEHQLAGPTDDIFFFNSGTGMFRVAAPDCDTATKMLDAFLDDPDQALTNADTNRQAFLTDQLAIGSRLVTVGETQLTTAEKLRNIGVLPVVAFIGVYRTQPEDTAIARSPHDVGDLTAPSDPPHQLALVDQVRSGFIKHEVIPNGLTN